MARQSLIDLVRQQAREKFKYQYMEKCSYCSLVGTMKFIWGYHENVCEMRPQQPAQQPAQQPVQEEVVQEVVQEEVVQEEAKEVVQELVQEDATSENQIQFKQIIQKQTNTQPKQRMPVTFNLEKNEVVVYQQGGKVDVFAKKLAKCKENARKVAEKLAKRTERLANKKPRKPRTKKIQEPVEIAAKEPIPEVHFIEQQLSDDDMTWVWFSIPKTNKSEEAKKRLDIIIRALYIINVVFFINNNRTRIYIRKTKELNNDIGSLFYQVAYRLYHNESVKKCISEYGPKLFNNTFTDISLPVMYYDRTFRRQRGDLHQKYQEMLQKHQKYMSAKERRSSKGCDCDGACRTFRDVIDEVRQQLFEIKNDSRIPFHRDYEYIPEQWRNYNRIVLEMPRYVFELPRHILPTTQEVVKQKTNHIHMFKNVKTLFEMRKEVKPDTKEALKIEERIKELMTIIKED